MGSQPFHLARLENAFRPILQRVLHVAHKLVRRGAVDRAMIVRKRQINHRADGDRVVDYYRALFNCAQPQNCNIGLVDYRKAK